MRHDRLQRLWRPSVDFTTQSLSLTILPATELEALSFHHHESTNDIVYIDIVGIEDRAISLGMSVTLLRLVAHTC